MKINPDEGYLLVLKSFPFYKEFNDKQFQTWAGFYEKVIIEKGYEPKSVEEEKLLKCIQINYDIRKILIGADCGIFGVVGK